VCAAELPPENEQKLKVENDQSHLGIRENLFGIGPDFTQLTPSLSVMGRLSKINADQEMQ